MFREHRKDCMFFSFTGAEKLDMLAQISNFVESIYDWYKIEPKNKIENWTDAFIFLKRTINDEIQKKKHTGKITLFFDEIPWVDRKNTDGFLSAFGHFWNTYCEKQNRFIVIICGSNAAWIKNKILKDTSGPLHNRITHAIAMKPFDLQETKEYLLKEKLLDLGTHKIVEVYLALGGVAKYLSYIDASLDINKNIHNLYFSMQGLMYSEYDIVFKSLFEDKQGEYKKIIDVLCSKPSGCVIGELVELTGIKNKTTLTKMLDELEMSGFLRAIGKYGNKLRDKTFAIADTPSLFHNKWVKELSKNDMANFNSNYWMDIVESQKFSIWSGFMFEVVILNNLELYLKARGTFGVVQGAYYWNYVDKSKNGDGAQIDLVVQYKGGIYDIVEVKYYNKEFTISADYSKKLKNKLIQFREHGLKGAKKSELKLVMLTSEGCKKNKEYQNLNISADITLDSMLK